MRTLTLALTVVVFGLSQCSGGRGVSEPNGIDKGPPVTAMDARAALDAEETNDERNYHGCWIGQKRGAIEFRDNVLNELRPKDEEVREFYFEESLIPDANNERRIYLIELKTRPGFFCMEKVNVVEVLDSGELHIDNYRSREDYEQQRRAGFCNLVRIDCE